MLPLPRGRRVTVVRPGLVAALAVSVLTATAPWGAATTSPARTGDQSGPRSGEVGLVSQQSAPTKTLRGDPESARRTDAWQVVRKMAVRKRVVLRRLPSSSTSPATPTPTVAPTSPTPTTSVPTTAAGILDALGVLPLMNFTGSGNVFAADVSRAPLNPNSANLVKNLANQVSSVYGGVAAFNVWNYNIGFATADADTPRQRVVWDNCQQKSYTPGQLYSPAGGAMFVDVPIPANAAAAIGSDGELAVWDPVTDKLWEFWKASKQADGWHACWGGRINNWSRSQGFFPNGTGATATGLAASSGLISIKQAQAKQINHAMSLGIRQAAHWSVFSYPAQRSDGGEPLSTPNAIAEGLRFRLDPTLDLSKFNLTPLGRAIAVAAQKYGFIVTDKSGAVGVQTESGQAAVAATGKNPWDAILAGTPSYAVMKNFPWDKLQALPFDYGKP